MVMFWKTNRANSRSQFNNIQTRLKCKRSNSHPYFIFNNKTLVKSKCSQITIFVIIAILIVVAIGIIFVVRNSLKNEGGNLPVGADNVGDFVTNCLKITAEKGIVVIGRQGGYYQFNGEPYLPYSGNDGEPGVLFTNLGSINVPYYFSGSITAPTKQKIEQQISLYIEDNIDKCLDGLSVFEKKGFYVEKGELHANASLFENFTAVYLDYPVQITKGNTTQEISHYSSKLPIRLGKVYELSTLHAIAQSFDQTTLCLNCLIDYKNEGFYTEALIYNNNTLIFVVTDTERKIGEEYYDFIFAYQY